jgi:hypothetical protein
MKKHNLKIVEPGAEGALEAATTAAAEAIEKLRAAEDSFARKYPGDHRLVDIKAHWEPERVAFYEEQRAVFDLRREAESAGRAVDQARARIAASVSEQERRAALATAIGAIVETERLIDSESKTAGKLKALLERARAGQSAAKTKCDNAVRAVDDLMSAGLGEYLGENEGAAAAAHDRLRAARAQKLEAGDDLEMANKAVAIAEAQLQRCELSDRRGEIVAAGAKVAALAGEVAASAIPRLLEEAKAMQLELEGRRQVLLVLNQFATVTQDDAISEYIADVIFPYGLDGSLAEDHPAAASWLAAIEALVRDAGAPLPKV